MQPGSPLYGRGVQVGLAFLEACRSCPTGAFPMCFSLHWDGTTSRRLTGVPICIGVANCNNMDKSTQFCLAYMPKLPNMGKTWTSTPAATQAKFHIRQQAVAAILRVMEAAAKRGVLCPMTNQNGEQVTLLLMPRLIAMNMDQPEAQLYFGLKNRTSCTTCVRRRGYSAMRRSKFQNGNVIQRLYAIVNDPATSQRMCTCARKKLIRYGFHPDRRCLLPVVADKLLVRLPNRQEVFPCVDLRDIMHGLIIFIHRTVCIEGLNYVSWSTRQKNILDRRLADVCAQRPFRKTSDGRTYRTVDSLFSAVDMSAADKVCVLFFLPHVIGHEGLMVPAEIREDLLNVVARAQLMLIACRGKREYTTSEFGQVFDEGYLHVFHAMERIFEAHHVGDYEARLQRNTQNPDRYQAPKQYKSNHRYVLRTFSKYPHGPSTITLTDFL